MEEVASEERAMSAEKHYGREVADQTQLGIGHNFLKNRQFKMWFLRARREKTNPKLRGSLGTSST
jgi:hypothetical protein